MKAMITKGAAVLAAVITMGVTAVPAFAASNPAGTPKAAQTSIASIEASIGAPATDDQDQAAIDALVKQQANTPGFKQKLQQLGDEMINKRITALNKLEATVNAMPNLSATEKATFDANIQTYLGQMTALEAKINGDTDLQTLITDVESITIDYRIYILRIPQTLIEANADSKLTVATALTAETVTLQQEINNSTSTNKAQAQLDLNDMEAKIVDAQTQANNAYAAVVNLVPDQGVKSVRDANKTALDGAQTDLHAAHADFKAARKDAREINKLLGLNPATTGTHKKHTIMKVSPLVKPVAVNGFLAHGIHPAITSVHAATN